MKVEELPRIEVSGMCSAMSGEELVKAIMLHPDWRWVASQKSNREKLAEFIAQSPWMDSILLLILSALKNPLCLDGERLFKAAKYAFWRKSDNKAFQNTKPRIKRLYNFQFSLPYEGDAVKIKYDQSGDLDELGILPLTSEMSLFYLLIPPKMRDCAVKKEQIIYSLLFPMEPTTSEIADFMRHPLWEKLNVEKIYMTKLVEISFSYRTVQKHEKFFWDVVKSFAFLITTSQVLSIRVRYDSLLPHEMASFWRDMYVRVVRADNAWLIDIPVKWKLHLSPKISTLSQLKHEWLCDLCS